MFSPQPSVHNAACAYLRVSKVHFLHSSCGRECLTRLPNAILHTLKHKRRKLLLLDEGGFRHQQHMYASLLRKVAKERWVQDLEVPVVIVVQHLTINSNVNLNNCNGNNNKYIH